MQASILDLYDPDRSQAVMHHGEHQHVGIFLADLNQLVREQHREPGRRIAFPDRNRHVANSRRPVARTAHAISARRKWHQFEPISWDNVREGARLAFGENVETHYRFDRADVMLSLDSDFLSTHPERLRYTRDFTNGAARDRFARTK